ncbi:MAG: hypothetical protein M1828_002314 [Chrysothrix sp. TS-e1954]|nr:MAG: hypothetical protein M1828_002314 [Chrysothrix sp. TS-e1954]
MVNWTAQVNEKLLGCILNIPGLKLDLNKLAAELSSAIGEAKAKNPPPASGEGNASSSKPKSQTGKASSTKKPDAGKTADADENDDSAAPTPVKRDSKAIARNKKGIARPVKKPKPKPGFTILSDEEEEEEAEESEVTPVSKKRGISASGNGDREGDGVVVQAGKGKKVGGEKGEPNVKRVKLEKDEGEDEMKNVA